MVRSVNPSNHIPREVSQDVNRHALWTSVTPDYLLSMIEVAITTNNAALIPQDRTANQFPPGPEPPTNAQVKRYIIFIPNGVLLVA